MELDIDEYQQIYDKKILSFTGLTMEQFLKYNCLNLKLRRRINSNNKYLLKYIDDNKNINYKKYLINNRFDIILNFLKKQKYKIYFKIRNYYIIKFNNIRKLSIIYKKINFLLKFNNNNLLCEDIIHKVLDEYDKILIINFPKYYNMSLTKCKII